MAFVPYPHLNTVALVGKPHATGIEHILHELISLLKQHGHQILLERHTAQAIEGETQHFPCLTLEEIATQAQVAIVLGGDGTMLDTARRLAPLGVPLIGINLGHLGFMTDIPLSEMHQVLPAILAGHYVTESRTLLAAQVIRDEREIFRALAFNDVVVNRSGVGGMVELAISVDQQFMCHQRSDGLIVATPTGSTAYALAAGGPILHPQLAGIVLAPIAPHALSNRPIVLPQNAVIEIQVTSTREVVVNFDMQSLTASQPGDRVIVQRANCSATFLHPLGYNYFATLREKLRWYDTPYAQSR